MLSFQNSVANSFQDYPARLHQNSAAETSWKILDFHFRMSEQKTKSKPHHGSKSPNQITVFQILHIEKEGDETIEEFGSIFQSFMGKSLMAKIKKISDFWAAHFFYSPISSYSAELLASWQQS